MAKITLRVQSQNMGSKLGEVLVQTGHGPNQATLHQPVCIINLFSHPCRQYMFTLCVCMVIGDDRGQHWDGRGVWATTSGMCNWDGRGQDYQMSKLLGGKQ